MNYRYTSHIQMTIIAIWAGLTVLLSASSSSLSYDLNGNQTSQVTSSALPSIQSAPTHQYATVGGLAGFSVSVSSSTPVTYQWNFEGSAINGATSDSLLITPVTLADEGTYTVTVTNSNGSVTSGNYQLSIDQNGNGLPDSWEQTHFGNTDQPAGGDFDGDGITNIDEFKDGTDPTTKETIYWIAESGDYMNPANWSTYRVPTVGDHAVIDSGTFILPVDQTLDVSQITINTDYTILTGRKEFKISGHWIFNGSFTLGLGAELAVSGGGGQMTIHGNSQLLGKSIQANAGSILSFPGLISYTQPENLYVEWRAHGTNSELIFPDLVTITGGTTPGKYLKILARNAGEVKLPALTTVTKPADGDNNANSGIIFEAYHNNSKISAPLLTTFQDLDPHPNSQLIAHSLGVISMPSLLAPQGININLNEASNPQQFTSLTGTRSLIVSDGTISMDQLDSITDLTFIQADAGAILSFPGVTSYTQPEDTNVTWQASRTNSELIFPDLVTITGSSTPGKYFVIKARNGGDIKLPRLTTVTKPADGDNKANSGIIFEAVHDGSNITAPLLSTFEDLDPYPNSRLHAHSLGVISMPNLLAPDGVNIDLNAASNPQRFTSLPNASYLKVNDGIVSMDELDSITGLSFIEANGGATLSFPGVTNYTQPENTDVLWQAYGTGSELVFPHLVTITGSTTPGEYFVIKARNGGDIKLPGLTTVTKPADGDNNANSGIIFEAVHNSSNITAPLLTTFEDLAPYPNSRIQAHALGVISMPSLLAPNGVNIDLNAASNPQRFTSLTNARYLKVNEGTVSMDQLASITSLTFIEANGGATLSLPGVTNYTQPENTDVKWQAYGNGSKLIFPDLLSITSGTTPGRYFDIIARNGALVSFPALHTITSRDDGDNSTNSGIRLSAILGGTFSAPNLTGFHDLDSHPKSVINKDGTGTFLLGELSLFGIKDVTLTGITLPDTKLSTFNPKITLTLNNVNLSILSINGYSYQLQKSSNLKSDSWSNVGEPKMGNGTTLQFSMLQIGDTSFARLKILPPS